MNWNSLSITAVTDVNNVLTPIPNLDVMFVLYDNTNNIYYYFDKTTNSNGVAALESSTAIVQSQISVASQTQNERGIEGYSEESREQGVSSYSIVTITNRDISTISQWFVTAVYSGRTLSSEMFDIQSATTGTLYNRLDDGGNPRAQATKIKVVVRNNGTPINDSAYVSYWAFSSSLTLLNKDVLTTTSHNDGYYCYIMGLDDDVTTIKIHAFYDGKYNIDTSDRAFTAGSQNNVIDIPLTGSGGYYFNINDSVYNGNFDVLYHYIGADISVYPIRMKILNDTLTNTYYDNVLPNKTAYTGQTGKCDTRYIKVQAIATSATITENNDSYILDISPTYESSTTKFDIFSHVGGIITVRTLIPRLKYMVETPIIYDTAEYSVSGDYLVNAPVYNLPNTDIEISWNTYGNTMSYSNNTSSNISAITINNDSIVNTIDQTNQWFYDCLAGRNVTNNGGGITYSNSLKIKFSKHHYLTSEMPFILSATQVGNYTLTGDTLDSLYVIKPDDSVSPIYLQDQRYKVHTIEREPCAVFRREDFVDYVRGFGYEYQGSGRDGGSSGDDRSGRIDFASYELTPTQKCTPSERQFYYEASSSLVGCETANTLTDFDSLFVGSLVRGNQFVTNYVRDNDLLPDYSDNNKHCYVMEETFIPVSGEGESYLYFTNENREAPVGYEDMERSVAISLRSYGNPYAVNLEYSYDSNPWREYTIGRKIYLPPGKTVFFRARTTNNNFSKDIENFYIFDIDNSLTNELCEDSYHTLIENNGSVKAAKYAVIVGGYISSLLTSSISNEAQLNTYGFYDLFGNTKLTSAKNLSLDLLSIPSHGYEYMFYNTPYIGTYTESDVSSFNVTKSTGPSIKATSIDEYGMSNMFENSGIYSLADNTLYIENLESHCCYQMFKNTRYNKKLTITAGNAYVASCFEEMFMNCTGTVTQLELPNVTTFGTDFCKKMFYSASTTKFSIFANPINTIGQDAFYEAFRYSHITSVNFTVDDTVGYRGCMYMCADLPNNCEIDDLHLDAENTSTLCYAYMFYNSIDLIGDFDFHINSIAESACTHMFHYASANRGVNDTHLSVKSNFNGTYICKLGPTSVQKSSYSYMFYGAGIFEVPKLPATNLTLLDSQECYSHMFDSSKITGFTDYYNEDVTGNTAGTEVVLNAVVLPDKCYEYMFANTDITRILYVITEDLEETGFKSCGHMFYNTKVEFYPRDTYIYVTGYPEKYVTFRYLGQTTFASNASNNYDNMRHLYRDARIKNGNIEILSGIKINRILNLFEGYDYKGDSPDQCSQINDCYCLDAASANMPDIYNNGYRYYEKHVTSTNPLTFSQWNGVTDEKRNFTVIGPFKKYSYNQSSDSLCGYTYGNIDRYLNLNATVLGDYCYEYMFAKCKSLYAGHNIKFNGLTQTSEGCFSHMFEECSNLRSMQPLLVNLDLSNNCFDSMYAKCGDYAAKKGRPALKLQKGLEIAGDYHYRFSGWTPTKGNDYVRLKHPNSFALEDDMNDTEYSDVVGICLKNFEERTSVNFSQSLSTECFKTMFSECRAIKKPKIKLQQTTLATGCYDGMFSGCSEMEYCATLNTTESSPAKERCFKNMFKFCLALKDNVCDILSPTTLEANCYEGMFSYCISLSAAPYLPATTLANGSYNFMFYSATNAKNKYKFNCSFTGTAFVGGQNSYSDSLEVSFFINTEGAYFTISDYGNDYTTRVKLREGGSPGNYNHYITYYQGDTNVKNFDGDFFTGLKSRLCQNNVLRSVFENAEVTDGHSGAKQLTIGYPDVLTLASNLNSLTDEVTLFMTSEYYDEYTLHRLYYAGNMIEAIDSVSNTLFENIYLGATSGVSYIKANLDSSQTGTSKTKQWVYMLEDNPNGEFVRASNGPTSRGENSVPENWSLHT